MYGADGKGVYHPGAILSTVLYHANDSYVKILRNARGE